MATIKAICCPVCFDTFQDPKALVCGHSVCAQCTKQLVKNRDGKRELPCPKCRKLTIIPCDADLPTNFELKSLVSEICSAKKPCDTCAKLSEKEDLWLCCKTLICASCVLEKHGGHEMKKFKIIHQEKNAALQEVLHIQTKLEAMKYIAKSKCTEIVAILNECCRKNAIVMTELQNDDFFEINEFTEFVKALKTSIGDANLVFSEHSIVTSESVQKLAHQFDSVPFCAAASHQKGLEYVVTLDNIMSWPEYFCRNPALSHISSSADKVGITLVNKVSLWHGDITKIRVDAIVNSSNPYLEPHAGTDIAIHRAAGPLLAAACAQKAPIPVGNAVITPGFGLPTDFIIHTVAQYDLGIMRRCYLSVLELAKRNSIKTIALPCIGTGAQNESPVKAGLIAVKAVRDWLRINANVVEKIVFVIYQEEHIDVYEALMAEHFPI